MHEKLRNQIERVEQLAQEDISYRQMLLDMRPIEKRYNAVLAKLPGEDQNAICDFVSQCEEMSWRMLELACDQKENTPPE